MSSPTSLRIRTLLHRLTASAFVRAGGHPGPPGFPYPSMLPDAYLYDLETVAGIALNEFFSG